MYSWPLLYEVVHLNTDLSATAGAALYPCDGSFSSSGPAENQREEFGMFGCSGLDRGMAEQNNCQQSIVTLALSCGESVSM